MWMILLFLPSKYAYEEASKLDWRDGQDLSLADERSNFLTPHIRNPRVWICQFLRYGEG